MVSNRPGPGRTLRSLEVNPLWGIVLTAPVDPSLPGNGFLSASRRSSRDPKPLLPSLLGRPFPSFSGSYDRSYIGERVLGAFLNSDFFRFDRQGRGEGIEETKINKSLRSKAWTQ